MTSKEATEIYLAKLAQREDAKLNEMLQIQEFLREYLAMHPCKDCGEANPAVLQFDHVRGHNKFAISYAIKKMVSMNALQAELTKCEVVCANCQAKRHHPECHVYLEPGYCHYLIDKIRDKRRKTIYRMRYSEEAAGL